MSVPAATQLTDKQQTFVDLVTSGVDATKAAELAGYSAPKQDAWRLSGNPVVAAAVAARARQHVEVSAVLASRKLVDLLNEKYPPAVQLKAATEILNRAGITEKSNDTSGKAGKPLSEMTEAELLDAYRRLRAEQDKLADSAREPGVIDGQAIEVTGQSTTPQA